MSNVTTNNDGGMNDAIDDLLQQWRNGGPTTQRRIVLSLAERAKLAEGRRAEMQEQINEAARFAWSAVNKLQPDENILDEWMARLIKKRKK
jgi:hypothetical protein